MITRNNLVFLELDRPTPSGRTYPKYEIRKALVEYQNKIVQGRTIGCFVDDINIATSTFDLKNASHKIISADIIGDNLVGTIQTLSTPKGQFLETLVDNPELHFDTRGMGQVDIFKVVTDFSIMGIDVYMLPGRIRPTLPSNPISDYDRAMGIVKR